MIAWIAATSPFGAPDEASHYDRALGIAHGTILGPKVDYELVPGLLPGQLGFIDHDTRAVNVPAALMPPDVSCIGDRPNLTSCPVATPNGNFPPLGYVLPAVALRASDDALTGLWLTRAASALQSIAFILLAIALVWDGSALSLLGLLAAVTPMVLFSSSIMNPSGIEIASSLAFAAAMLRIARGERTGSRRVWCALALSGAVSILSGPIGLVFALADIVLLAGLLGGRRLLALGRVGAPRVAVTVLAGAAVIELIYSHLAGFSTHVGFTPLGSSLTGGLRQLTPVLDQAVGVFASLTVPLSSLAWWIWWLLVLAIVAAAMRLADRRERAVMAAVTLLALAFPVLFWAWVDRYTGFGLQAREILPVLMLIPLLAGELLARHRPAVTRLSWTRWATGAAIAAIAVFQAYAWWISAAAAAGGGTSHGLDLLAHPLSSPPLGWVPWIIAAGAGTVALLGLAAATALERPPAVSDLLRERPLEALA